MEMGAGNYRLDRSFGKKAAQRFLAILRLMLRSVPDEFFGARLRCAAYRRMFGEATGRFTISSDVVITGFRKIRIGEGSSIMSSAKLYAHESAGIWIGNRCSINHNVALISADGGSVRLGDNVLIGPNAVLVAANHDFINPDHAIRTQGNIGKVIEVEDDVWIGSNCVILGGTTIGKGSVIGAGAVVTKSIPRMQVWGGVPAKFIKSR